MNQLQKQQANQFTEKNTQASKLSSLIQFNDPNRQKPNLLRINADNQDKKFMCIFWTIFLVFVVTLAIVSKTLPSAIKPITNSSQLANTYLQGCFNPNTFTNDILQCGTFTENNPTVGVVTQKLSSMNQFVAFWLYITPNDIQQPLFFDQNITYIVNGLEEQEMVGVKYFKRYGLFQNQTVNFQYTSQSTSYFYAEDSDTIKGYKIFLGFIGQFPSTNIYLALQFSGPFSQFDNINAMQIQGYKISKSFTGFTIAIRQVFFVFSILAAYLYIRKYRKIPVEDRIIEQKLIAILSIMLIFFNDPFYPITVLKENMARYEINQDSSFFSTLFVVGFIVYVIFMWAIFYDRIYFEEGKKETEQIKLYKILVAAFLFILLMILYMLYAGYRLNQHPLVPTQKLNDRTILILDVLTSLCFGLIMIYIIYRYMCICCNKPDRLWRSQLFMSYSFLFMLAMVVFIFTDNALGAYRYDGTTVIFLYGLMNFYVWYIQYMYSPTKETAQQLSEKRSLNSDQIMSIGTMQFNDPNINLDDDESYRFGLNPNKQVAMNNQIKGKNVSPIDNYKWGKDYEYKQKHRKSSSSSSSQDQTSAYNQRNKITENFNNDINRNDNDLDFFSQQHENQVNQNGLNAEQKFEGFLPQNNDTNLLHLSDNKNKTTSYQQEISHPQQFQSAQNVGDYQQVDQKNLQIMSEYQSQVTDQQNNNHKQHQNQGQKNKSNEEQGFGAFELQ